MSSAVERRDRIGALGFDYASQERRHVRSCNLCGRRDFVGLAHRDRYGYAARADGCLSCGLVFLNPVMTAAAYRRFYVGTYRPLVSAYHGRLIDARTIQAEQREYAAERGDLLAPWLEPGLVRTLLDIGGSTGVVAHALATRFKLQAAVLDPSPLEVDEARRLGLETIESFVEDYEPGGRRFDVVTMCQTVDHLLDISGTLRRVRSLLPPHGVFFVDIVDLRAGYLRHWSFEEAIKIDHPHYLTESSMLALLKRAGFEVERKEYAADHLHIGYICRPADAAPEYLPDAGDVAALWREIRTVQNASRPVVT